MRNLIVTGMLLALSVSASAGDEGFYVGAEFLSADSELNDGAQDHNDRDNGWALMLGYDMNANFAVELSAVDYGTAHLPVVVDGGGSFESDGFSLAALGKYPLGNATVYGKLGLLRWDSEQSLGTIAGVVRRSDSGNSLLAGVGLAYSLMDNLNVHVDYQMTEVADNDVDVVSLGFRFRF